MAPSVRPESRSDGPVPNSSVAAASGRTTVGRRAALARTMPGPYNQCQEFQR